MPCAVHAKLCTVSAVSLDIFQAGYSCCWNSPQNPKRFQQDIVENPHEVHEVSYLAAKELIATRKPSISILENSRGLEPRGRDWSRAGFPASR